MRQTFREGGGFEEAAAYSRAVRLGQHVAVSGTAHGTAATPTRRRTEALQRALSRSRASSAPAPEDVLRTRLLLVAGCDWEAVVRAHREAFAGVEPANTTYFVGRLHPEGVLVEVELDAIVAEPPR